MFPERKKKKQKQKTEKCHRLPQRRKNKRSITSGRNKKSWLMVGRYQREAKTRCRSTDQTKRVTAVSPQVSVMSAALSSQAAPRGGPAAVTAHTGVAAINTACFYCHWHTWAAKPSPVKEHSYFLYAMCCIFKEGIAFLWSRKRRKLCVWPFLGLIWPKAVRVWVGKDVSSYYCDTILCEFPRFMDLCRLRDEKKDVIKICLTTRTN